MKYNTGKYSKAKLRKIVIGLVINILEFG